MSIDPLPSVVIFGPESNSLKVYSLTGHLLVEKKLKTEVLKMVLVPDLDGCDVLVLLDDQSGLTFLRLPDLEEARNRIKVQRLGLVDMVACQHSLVLSTDSEIIVFQ